MQSTTLKSIKSITLLVILFCYFGINTYSQNRIKLPYIEDLKIAYPKHYGSEAKTTMELAEEVGGEVLNIYQTNNNRNSCAMRISMALNKSNVKIEKSNNPKTFKGSNDKYYILSAEKMIQWMKTYFPKPTFHYTVTEKMKQDGTVLEKLKNREGIFAMKPVKPSEFGATGHVDLFFKDENNQYVCDGGCFEDRAYEIYFWELPKRN